MNLQAEAYLELVRRSIPGAMAYSALLVVVGLFTPFTADYPWLLETTTVVLAVIGIGRLVMAKRILRNSEIRYQTVIFAGVLSSALVWSAFSTLTLAHYSEQWTGMIVLLMTAGIAAGGMTSLAPHLRLTRVYLMILLVPPLVAAALSGGAEGYGAAMTIAIYAAFLLFESQHQHTSYRQALEDREQLRLKARELGEAKTLADEATDAKSTFLAKMSHEIRTPMNAVIGMTDLLLDSGLDAQRQRFVKTIKQSSESLLSIINDILDLSKIEAGKLVPDPVPFNLRDSVHDVLRVLALRAHSKELELSCRILPNVPDALTGEAGRLRQVLINLVGNAIKFTSQGGIVIQIEVADEREQSVALHFSVADTGVGIPEKQQERVFRPFAQADSAISRQYGGTGLGLSISRALVEMMGGRMWIESAPGKGSTLHFTAIFEVRGAAESRLPAEDLGSLAGLHVLVVENDVESARIIGEMIQSWRMRSTTAHSIQTAQSALENSAAGASFDFILIDAEMAHESGFDLAQQIIKNPALPPPVMMLTSTSEAEGRSRCRELGIAQPLVKPISESDLFDSLISAYKLRTGAAAGMPPSRPRAVDDRGKGLHILLVEDNVVNQEVAQHMLTRAGYSVETAINGREALRKLASSAYDLILMDIQMPEMDGFQTTAAIRDMEKMGRPRTPIVAMTAHAMRGDREQCLEAGMDGYISKPVQSSVLFETIESVLPRKPTPSVLNGEAILNRQSGNVAMLQSLAKLFAETWPSQMSEIHAAIEQNDAHALISSAHKLKGSLMVLSGDRAAETARQLEVIGKSGSLAEAPKVAETLKSEILQLAAELEQLVGTSGHS